MIWYLPQKAALAAVLATANNKFSEIEKADPETVNISYFDDFAHSIIRRGYVLLKCDKRLKLIGKNKALDSLNQQTMHFASECEPLAFSNELAKLIGSRKLLQVAKFSCQYQQITVRDDEQKALLRAEFYTTNQNVFCVVKPIRGYEKAAQQFQRFLIAEKAEVSDNELYQLMLMRSGFEVSAYSNKPHFNFIAETKARDAVRQMSATMLQLARENESGLAKHNDDPEFLHDYRICIRKVRSLIGLLKDVYPNDVAQKLKHRLGDIFRCTSELRDLDVYLLEQDAYSQLIPPELATGLPEMFNDFAARQKQLRKQLIRWLSGAAYEREIKSLICFFKGKDSTEATDCSELEIKSLINRKVVKRYQKISKLGRTITSQTPDDDVHELRKECKKFRYLLEFFAGLYDEKPIKQLIKRLKVLQDTLGKFNDYSVQQTSLNEYLAKHPSNIDLAKSIGALIFALAQKQQQQRCLVEAKFAQFADHKTNQLLVQLFTTQHPTS